MLIKYYIKNVYGVDRRYIKDPEIATQVKNLTNMKTLEPRHIDALTNLGFKFVQVLNTTDGN